jgi:cell wall-associated NlpC family hydrolase
MPAYSRTRSIAVLAVTVTAALLASLFITAPGASAMTRSQRIVSGLNIAQHQKGDPYSWGAAGPGRFDCSGLIYYSYRQAGIDVPRTSSAQAAHARRIPTSQLRPGDFVFFYHGAARAGNVYHVGIYSGVQNGQRTILHAPRPGQRVKTEPIWTSQWFAGTLR